MMMVMIISKARSLENWQSQRTYLIKQREFVETMVLFHSLGGGGRASVCTVLDKDTFNSFILFLWIYASMTVTIEQMCT